MPSDRPAPAAMQHMMMRKFGSMNGQQQSARCAWPRLTGTAITPSTNTADISDSSCLASPRRRRPHAHATANRMSRAHLVTLRKVPLAKLIRRYASPFVNLHDWSQTLNTQGWGQLNIAHLVAARWSPSANPRRRASPAATIAARNSSGPASMFMMMVPICAFTHTCQGKLLPSARQASTLSTAGRLHAGEMDTRFRYKS